MKLTEIFRLKKMLEEAKIPFVFDSKYDFVIECYRFQIIIEVTEGKLSAIQDQWSYGSERNLIEIMGGMTPEEQKEDGVLGYLTAREVFERFSHCYKSGGLTYYKEAPNG